MMIPVMTFILQQQLITIEPTIQFTVLSLPNTKITWTSQEGSHIFQVG